MRRSTSPTSLLTLALCAGLACGSEGAPPPDDIQGHDTLAADTLADDGLAPDGAASDGGGDTSAPPDALGPCDPLDPSLCALPWPSSLYLEPDAERVTGYTLSFRRALPANKDGVPIDAAPYRRMDGYGLGEPLLIGLPNLDVTGLPSEWDVPPSLDDDAAILWFEVGPDGESLTRIPYWIDVDTAEEDPAERITIVRPGVILREATRYIVALRGLVDTTGRPLPTSPAFAALRAGDTAGDPALAPRQARFDDLLSLIEAAGIDTATLQLAWDFSTASSEALHGPLLHMRDDALAKTGPEGPELLDIEVETFDDAGPGDWALELRGRLRVPQYLRQDPGYHGSLSVWVLNRGADGLPEAEGWVEPEFLVRVPYSALDGAPHGVMLYGHGQQGSRTQARSGGFATIANEGHLIYVACDLWGMAEGDINSTFEMLADLSAFPWISDRLHQGILNHLLLARAMHTRLPQLPALTSRGVVIDTARVTYSWISQGGNYGPTIVATSPDITRGHCSMSGPQYSYLLFRSRNFEPFLFLLGQAYPGRAAQLVAVQALQQLWNGTDSLTYLPHIHTPLAGSPPNRILITIAKGDVQVAPSANDLVARSPIDIPVMAHYDAERGTISGAIPADYPREGSGIVLYSFGNPWPAESVNAPPTSDYDDPHDNLRRQAHHNSQLIHFLETGEIIDVCGGDGCTPR